MSFDVIVVGAGPAGSTAARELAASGARVIVVDRAEFPRYKACGGGIPLRTERFLPFPITPVIEETIDRIDVTYGGRWRFTRDSGAPFAHMVMRDRFDALLLAEAQKAGAEFRPATTIRALDLRPGRATVQADGFEASAPLLICADGAHSPVGRMAGLGGDLQECAAWEVEVEAGERVHQFHTRSLIELGYRPWGYAWIFPKEQLLSFGVVLPRDQANTMKEHVSRFLDRYALADAPVRIARGHKIRFRRAEERIAEGNVLLAGDAAGLADEFTQEGIFYAISSGRIAARSALQALATSGDLAPYQRAVDAEIQPELRGARLIAFMFYGMLRRLPRPWMWASGHTGYLWDAFFAVQRGESTYAREVARVPLLPWAAAKLLDRG